ncbi:MAG TPA: hypothetical protein ENH05_08655 [Rhizobiales bacterium]|nr:hypothetical protein BMS3Bbin10_00638 [bacterium BMS3Bbin10]HDO52790.1 hypothetical protein [Hyphomicrobiales bacterium]
MLHGIGFSLRDRLHPAMHAAFAFTFAAALLVGFSGPLMAQEKLTPAQETTMAQCLAGCKKGDANCQNSCTTKTATPAYFSAAGSCVRACADALAGPGQPEQSRVGDLVQCVRACN